MKVAASTNKNGINVSTYVIASNDFATEYHEPAIDNREEEGEATQKKIKIQVQGNFQGKQKLLDFVRVAMQKHNSIRAYRTKIGDIQYNCVWQETTDMLNDRDTLLKEIEADAKVESMMINLEVQKELLAKVRKKGVDCPQEFSDTIPFALLASPKMCCT